MSEAMRYEVYCRWCRGMKVAPAPYQIWRETLRTVAELSGL